MPRRLPDELYSSDFMTYAQGLSTLKPGDCTGIDDGDLAVIMRVFYWYVHEAGFQDIYDQSFHVMKLLRKCEENAKLDKNDYDFQTVMRFTLEFVKNGNYFSSSSNMLYSLNKMKDTIKANMSEEEYRGLEKYLTIFNKMQETEHVCYYLLREIIKEDHFDSLFGLVKTFAPEHQDWILHALDHFKGNQRVIDFYTEMLNNTGGEWLKEEINTYLDRVK